MLWSPILAPSLVWVPAHSFVPYSSLGQVYTQNFDSLPIPNAITYNTANPQPMTVVTNIATGKTVSYTYSLANPFDFAYPIISSGLYPTMASERSLTYRNLPG